MRISTLEYLITTAQCPTITAAAQRLYLNQTTLSAIISKAEAELGFRILMRSKSGIFLTPKGEAFIHLAEQMMPIWGRIRSLGTSAEEMETVRLLMHPVAYERYNIELISQFRNCVTDVDLNIIECPENQILDQIGMGEAVCGLAYVQDEEGFIQTLKPRKLCYQRLFTDTRYLYASRDSDYAQKKRLTMQDLKEAHYVYSEKCAHEFMASNLAAMFHCNTTVSNANMARRAVRELGLVALFMSCELEENDWFCADGEIVRLNVVDLPQQTKTNYLVYPMDWKPSAQEKRLLQCIRNLGAHSEQTEPAENN